MKDFFISYTSADRAWAEWIAWQLEDSGYSVIIQAWDFRPGSDFIAEMDSATREAQRTIAALSEKYFQSRFTQAEWSAAFQKGKLLPVRIQDFDVEGLLSVRIYIDLVGKDEDAAAKALRDGVKGGRSKPKVPPKFPVTAPVQRTITSQPPFPGPLQSDGRLDHSPHQAERASEASLQPSRRIDQSLLQFVVYVNTLSPGDEGQLPEDVRSMRDWHWLQSAHVRWVSVAPHKLEARLNEANLAVVNWSSDNSPLAEKICKQIRARRPDLPILIIYSGQGRSPNRKAFIGADSRGAGESLSAEVPAEILSELPHPRIDKALKSLGFQPKEPMLKLSPDEDDLVIEEITDWIKDRQHLRLIIQKFFPKAEHALAQPINGGWAEARLCQISVEKRIYVLKFFERKAIYLNELDRHEQAGKWLGRAAAALQSIPELADQREAFLISGLSRYPVCYDSVTSHNTARVTLKECYRSKSDEFMESALGQLLDILAADQPGSHSIEHPWGDAKENTFDRTRELKMSVRATLDDLAPYGRRMHIKRGLFRSVMKASQMVLARFWKSGADANLPEIAWGPWWRDCQETLQRLVYNPLPLWLTTPALVVKGHIHGNPTSCNCFVNPDKAVDLRLINCGGYRPNGRLVSDLALIERDLKFVLMGTEANAPGLLDLEVEQLSRWFRAESAAVLRGLDYEFHLTLTSSRSVRRAYSLIGKVRQRARDVSKNDPEGRHYFAALLYWTLEILRNPEARPTKKLLALHSATEIIRVFDS